MIPGNVIDFKSNGCDLTKCMLLWRTFQIMNIPIQLAISAGNNWEDQQRIRSLATDSFQGWKVELSTNLRVFSQCPRKASTRAFALLLI